MSSKDWFRKTSWTKEDEQDFFARIARARTASSKAQYLRIQAYHLVEDASPPLPLIALRLLDQLLEKFPDSLEIAQALHQKAICLKLLNQPEETISAFRQVLAREAKFPNVKTNTSVDFPFYVVEKCLINLYDEAWEILLRDKDSLSPDESSPFPITRFRFNTAAAFILDSKKETSLARAYAQKALEAASASHSGFSRHKYLGLVIDVPTKTVRKLKAIASKT